MPELLITYLLTNPASSAASGGSVDWIARALSVVTLITTISLAIYTNRGKIWRGRREAADSMRESLDQLIDAVAVAHQTPSNLQRLWAAPIGVALVDLRSQANRLPDRKLCRLLKALVDQVAVAKGDIQPNIDDTDEPRPISDTQIQGLARALDAGRLIRARLDKTSRLAARG